jgi:hypothetical protein
MVTPMMIFEPGANMRGGNGAHIPERSFYEKDRCSLFGVGVDGVRRVTDYPGIGEGVVGIRYN